MDVEIESPAEALYYRVGAAPAAGHAVTASAARQAVNRLVLTMIDGAHQRGFYVLTVFFFNEALLKLPRLFPLTD